MEDFKLDENNSLTFSNGDFVVDVSDSQNVKLICQYDKGHLKQYPKLGVGMENMINGRLDQKMKNIIQKELKSDGYKVKEIYTDDDGEIIINY